MLPLLGMLYIDILETRNEVKYQQEQVQKLINQAKKDK
jgi:hypothetical protein